MTTNELQNRIKVLELELVTKDALIAELQRQLEFRPSRDECTEYKGALFQRIPAGGYREAIFCAVCRSPMTPTAARTHFDCRHCHHHVEFPGQTLANILQEVRRNT